MLYSSRSLARDLRGATVVKGQKRLSRVGKFNHSSQTEIVNRELHMYYSREQ